MSLAAMAILSHKQTGKLVARLPCGICADFGFECAFSCERFTVYT